MKKTQRILSLLLSIVLLFSMLPAAALAAETGGIDNFKKINSYADASFSDVSSNDWFYENVKAAYELGLMVGRSSTAFGTNENITIAETMTIAARLHAVYHTGKADFVQKSPWYRTYTDYCAANGIANPDDYDLRAVATRAQFAVILANSMPDAAWKEINSVADNAIPDVKITDAFGKAVYKLYRAGILVGNDASGVFAPYTNIRRSEIAAIITRMADASLRKSIWLETKSTDKWVPVQPDPVLPKLEIVISNEGDPIVTDDATITISGTVISDAGTKNVSAVRQDYYEENAVCTVTGTSSWSFNSELAIGTNIFTITATDITGQSVSKTLNVNRNSTQIEYSDTVKVADEDDYQKLYDEIIAVWNDDNNTPEDESDDKIVMLVPQRALLLSQIEAQMLQPGEVYLVPQNDLFLTGFSGVYVTHRAPIGNADYPAAAYPDADYEEILFTYPNFSDLFNSDISIDLSSGIDPENPIAFSALPDGTEIDIEYENTTSALAGNDTKSTVVSYAVQTGDMIGNPLYSKKGWITDELKTKMLPKISASVDRYNRVNVSLKWADVVLYDHDGVKNETAVDAGQVKLSGEFYVKNLKHEGGIEWHPSLWPWDVQILPQQLKSKLSYNYGGKIQLKTDATATTEGLVKLANSGFENKAKFLGLTVSGTDTFKDKIVLGVIGFNLVPPRVIVAKSISGQAAASTLTPEIVLFLFFDLDGEFHAEAVLTAGYNASVEKGYNIQKNGYTGSYGSQAQNRSDKHYNVGNDYTLDIYDKDEGEFVLNLSGKAEATLEAGIGLGAGLLIGGICPATVDGSFFGRIGGEAEGTINFLPEFGLEGEASLYAGCGVQANINAAIAAKFKRGTAGFSYDKHFEHMIWETTLSTSKLTGIVYQSDNDGDNTNNVMVDGAKITLKKNDTGKVWTTTSVNSLYDASDENKQYNYQFNSLPKGEYTLTVEKDGYATYRNAHFLFEGTTTHNIFIDKIAPRDGICTLSGKITIADEDTDTTNNPPLPDAEVTISSYITGYSATTRTAADGTYSFAKLAPGNYTIMVSKQGYLTIIEAVAISDNTENVYNALLEAISDAYKGNGSASGVVYDAINGKSVAGLTLTVRSGVNISSGTVLKTLKTDAEGRYAVNNIPAGNYTIQITDERSLDNEDLRYRPSMFVIKVLGNCSIPNQNGYVTNGLRVDQLRVVLRWGENPRDLDSHLVGPTADGGRFHIYYSNKTSGRNYLDHDDTSSYGPETITIYETTPGVYTYLVHDYTNRNSSNSNALAQSGAYVEVYYGDSQIALETYYVPNQEGTVWSVFEFDATTGTITPINQMSYCSTPGKVGSGTTGSQSVSSFSADRGMNEELKDYELIN